ASMAVLYGLSLMIYSSAVEMSAELPRYTERAQNTYDQLNALWNSYFGSDASGHVGGSQDQRLQDFAKWMVNTATEALAEAVGVGFYLLFLLLEAHHYPERIRSSFQGE